MRYWLRLRFRFRRRQWPRLRPGFRRWRRWHWRRHWRGYWRWLYRFGPRGLRLRGFRLRCLTSIWGGVWCHLAGDFVVGHRGLTGTICAHQEMIPSRALRPPRRGRPALLRHRVRRHPGRTAATAAAPGPPRRTRTPRRAPVQAPAPDHRIDQSDLKSQLHLDRHGGHTPAGVMVRILQRILALTAAIWHNDHTAAPVHRSLTAYDH